MDEKARKNTNKNSTKQGRGRNAPVDVSPPSEMEYESSAKLDARWNAEGRAADATIEAEVEILQTQSVASAEAGEAATMTRPYVSSGVRVAQLSAIEKQLQREISSLGSFADKSASSFDDFCNAFKRKK